MVAGGFHLCVVTVASWTRSEALRLTDVFFATHTANRRQLGASCGLTQCEQTALIPSQSRGVTWLHQQHLPLKRLKRHKNCTERKSSVLEETWSHKNRRQRCAYTMFVESISRSSTLIAEKCNKITVAKLVILALRRYCPITFKTYFARCLTHKMCEM